MMILVPHFGRQEATEVSSVGPELILCPKSGRARKRKYDGNDLSWDRL